MRSFCLWTHTADTGACRLASRSFPRLAISNVLFVFALFSAKEWLLSYDVGVFWVVMRVLAIGGLSTLVWEATNSQFAAKDGIEVCCKCLDPCSPFERKGSSGQRSGSRRFCCLCSKLRYILHSIASPQHGMLHDRIYFYHTSLCFLASSYSRTSLLPG